MSERYLYVVLRPLRETPDGATFGVLISEEGVPYKIPSYYGMELETLISTPGYSHIFEWNYEEVNRQLPGLLGRYANEGTGVNRVAGFLEYMAQGLRHLLKDDPFARKRHEIGSFFYEHVFRNEAGEKLKKAITDSREEHSELKLRLVLESPSLNPLPWECMFYQPESTYLGQLPEVTLARFRPSTVTWRQKKFTPPLKVLIVDGQQLSTERFFDLPLLMHRLDQATENLKIDLVRPTSRDHLEESIFSSDYHVIHFFTHLELGTNVSNLVLPEKGPEPDRIQYRTYQIQELSRLFLGTNVRLMVLTPCVPSGNMSLGNLIGSRVEELGIPAVLVTQMRLSDTQIAQFSHSFYAALGEGQAVDRAVANAQKQLVMNQRGPVGAFALFLNTSDSELFGLKTADVVATDISATDESIISVIQQVESITGKATGVSIDTILDGNSFETNHE
jgi:hypothetical protein